MRSVEIYTDGSYDNPNRLCGAAYVVLEGERVIHEDCFAWYAKTTSWNIESELQAVDYALDWIEKENIKSVVFYCDLINCIKHIRGEWKGKQPQSYNLKNRCNSLREKGVMISAVHVKGHSGNEYNERCDKLAYEALKELKPL